MKKGKNEIDTGKAAGDITGCLTTLNIHCIKKGFQLYCFLAIPLQCSAVRLAGLMPRFLLVINKQLLHHLYCSKVMIWSPKAP